MKWLESIVAYLAPSILLEGTPWKSGWQEQERSSFTFALSIWFAFATVGYIGHYFFFDRVNGLEPLDFWFSFRMSMATAMFMGFLFYISPLVSWRLYKFPALLLIWVMCFTQSKVTLWYSIDAWFFCFVFIIGSAFILRLSPVKTLGFAAFAIVISFPALSEAGLPTSWFGSAAVVTLLLIAVVRAANLSDVKTFLLEKENAAAQKQIIELNLEFADRIRAFIPKVIAERLENLVSEKRFSILQASVEVLRPETKNVACLFSDIRGFTQGSKDLQSFVNESVVPEVRACSDVIELYSGIPRKIGDLVFAYFDDDDIELNVVRAMVSSIEMAQVNEDMNQTATSLEVRRYILVSAGPAIVGNIGGLDSSMEITALGSPVNFLSRLDDATKVPSLAKKLSVGDVLFSEEVKRILDGLNASIELEGFDLEELDVHIRDFPETKMVYAMRPTDANHSRLLGLLERNSGNTVELRKNNEPTATIWREASGAS